MTLPTKLSTKERQEILLQEIEKYVKRGFRVVSQTETTAQLIKPKRFNFWLALILFLVFILPLIIYIFWHISRKDKTVYISVDEVGNIKIKK